MGDAAPNTGSAQGGASPSGLPQEVARQWRRPTLDGPSLAAADIGFAELGRRGDSGRGVVVEGAAAPQAKLHPYRTFWPGQTYAPEVRLHMACGCVTKQADPGLTYC